jgi:outer membrane protein OmpA-like peptidoglycan-associated protein
MRAISAVVLMLVVVGLAFPVAAGKRKQIQLTINKSDVDLANRTLFFKLNHTTDSAEIKIYDPEGTLISEKVEMYSGAAAGTRLSISWPDLLSNKDNFRLELKVTDMDEFWVGWEVIRFYLEIPHEEVVFASGKADIRQTEAPKLDRALKLLIEAVAKYGKLMQCEVYVAGHTDTVGKVNVNRELSRKRARSIAAYFSKNGLKKVPIHVRGFGEESLKIDTGDSVSEERNRRADYIISTFPPEISGPGSWVRTQ